MIVETQFNDLPNGANFVYGNLRCVKRLGVTTVPNPRNNNRPMPFDFNAVDDKGGCHSLQDCEMVMRYEPKNNR